MSDLIRVEPIALLPTQAGCAVFLGDGKKAIVFYIDPAVGASINASLSGHLSPRPLTHDLYLHTLQAFELFQRNHPEAHFWVAGWGTEEAALRRHVEQHGTRNVTFWGRVPEATRNELLQRAEVLCTSPLREGWGLVVTEANAMGTPVIGYDVPGLRDALAFRNGWLCACTPEKMAEKLEEVHRLWSADPAAYGALRARCLESARAFTFDRSYEQFTGVLAEKGIPVRS